MTLNEFKVIYYWEYVHRVLGRILGLLFLLPFIYISSKVLNNNYNWNFFILFLLILLQKGGTVGWYMVKSGLVDNTTVSHYRLAIHLNLALILFSAIFWYLLNIQNKKIRFFHFKTIIILFYLKYLFF